MSNYYALSNDQMVRRAPAVFSLAPHTSRSSRYIHIPTLAVINHLRDQGFEPFDVQVAKVRDATRLGFQKHLIRLRHASNIQGARGGVAELVMINSHDGTTSYNLIAGWFEFLCANGLMVGAKAASMRVQHKGVETDVVKAVGDGANSMLAYLHRLADDRQAMLDTPLSWAEQQAFAKSALLLRYDSQDAEGKPKPAPVEPYQILSPRRQQEAASVAQPVQGIARTVMAPKPDLWTTFQVVQENLVRGGTMGTVNDSRGNRRYRRQRAVEGIDQNTSLNRALWTLADEMRKLKS